MYCSSCGKEIPDTFNFCSHCGVPRGTTDSASTVPRAARVLRRPREDRKIGGVCGGLANYMGIDVTLVRVIALCLIFWPPASGLILYIVCWILMPEEPRLLAPPAQPAPASSPASM